MHLAAFSVSVLSTKSVIAVVVEIYYALRHRGVLRDAAIRPSVGPALLLLLYMSIIMVALSHYCCRTTLQCQCHAGSQSTETLPKQHSFQFLTEGDQSRHGPAKRTVARPARCAERRPGCQSCADCGSVCART